MSAVARPDSVDVSTAGELDNAEKAALAGMLEGYPKEQLVSEVLSAWTDLGGANSELADLKQRVRMLELDLEEREEEGAPDRALLDRSEAERRDLEARVLHLERLLEDARAEREALSGSMTQQRMIQLETDRDRLQILSDEQQQVIEEMESRLSELVEALQNAADAGLTSLSAEQVRFLEAALSDSNTRIAELDEEMRSTNSERDRLREITERLRTLVEQRDERISELETIVDEIRHGPRSISAEHDYLVEQIEELKRRLLERNREYESLRRRERKLHKDVFERDERLAQLQLTITDFEAALQDRMAELKEIEIRHDKALNELQRLRDDARTRDVVDRAFIDSLTVRRSAEEKNRSDNSEEEITSSNDAPNLPGGYAPPADLDDD